MDAETSFDTEAMMVNSSSSESSFSIGFIIAIAMISFTCLVLSSLGCYYLYVKHQLRRQAEQRAQQRQEQQQEQERQEELKNEERVKNVQEKLQVVNFSGSCEHSACSTDSTAPSMWSSSRSSSRRNSLTSSESGEISSESESDENENDDQEVPMVDLEAQISDQHANHHQCCEMDIEAQSDCDSDENDGDNNCPICFASFEHGDLVSISNHKECKHTFHKECITEWLLKQDGCPVCRRSYLEKSATEEDEETADATRSRTADGELDC